jgi:hypothetical protein
MRRNPFPTVRQNGILTQSWGLAVLAGLAIVLLGCSKNSFLGSLGSVGGGGDLSGLACPQVAILEAPGALTRFSEGKVGNISDVRFQARMEVTRVTCDIEEKVTYVTANAKLVVLRGPAETTGEVNFSFFVAILDGHKEVILRQAFPIIVKFEGPQRKIEFEDSISFEIDRKENVDPGTYTIYAGFEMSPEELKFNRRRLR